MKTTENGPTVECAKQNGERIPGMRCDNCPGQCEKIIPLGYITKQLTALQKEIEKLGPAK